MLVYKRGQGWLEETFRTRVVTLRCGTKVRLEARKPLLGERYSCAWSPTWCEAPGIIKLDIISEIFTGYDYLNVCDGTYHYDNKDPNYATGWVTVVAI